MTIFIEKYISFIDFSKTNTPFIALLSRIHILSRMIQIDE